MEETLTLIEKTAVLKNAPIFGHMPTEAVAELASRAQELHFEGGTKIFSEGDANRGVFMVVDGRVEIYKGRALDAVRMPGDGFGELALGEGEPHQFAAVAALHTHVLNVSNETFFDAILDFPEVGVAMVKGLSERITELAQRVHELEGKMAHLNATLQQAGLEAPSYSSGAYPRPEFRK